MNHPVHRPLGPLLAAAGLVACLAACQAPDHCAAASPTEPGRRAVLIDNRSGTALHLCRVKRDSWDACQVLGAATRIRLDLTPGRWAVRLGADGPRIPLPLPAAGLGFVPPPLTRVCIRPWPPADPGWCWIPPGPGLRGDALGVGQEEERPLATPDTAGFWLAARETTNAQYVAFLNAIPRDRIDPGWLDLEGPKCGVAWDAARRSWTTDAPDLPVVTVSWFGATAYCRWRTTCTGVPHRLPGETEWEKAARGPGSRVYAYGDTCTRARANQESGRLRATARFPANGFGLHDMTGNAFEWTRDAWPRPDRTVTFRALRGGSFVLDGIFVRNAMRMRLRPEVRADDVGFRVLRENRDPRFGPLTQPLTQPLTNPDRG